MNQPPSPKKGIIRKSGTFRHRLTRHKVKAGSFMIVTQPAGTSPFLLFVLPMILGLVTYIFTWRYGLQGIANLPISADIKHSLSYNFWGGIWSIPGTVVGLSAFICGFSLHILRKIRGGPSFVFYQACLDSAAAPDQRRAHYEIRRGGRIRKSGFLSEKSLCHATDYSKEQAGKHCYIRCQTRLQLHDLAPYTGAVHNDKGHRDTPTEVFNLFSEDASSDDSRTIGERYKFVRKRARELREFLDLPLEGSMDYVHWDEWSAHEYEINRDYYSQFQPPPRVINNEEPAGSRDLGEATSLSSKTPVPQSRPRSF